MDLKLYTHTKCAFQNALYRRVRDEAVGLLGIKRSRLGRSGFLMDNRDSFT